MASKQIMFQDAALIETVAIDLGNALVRLLREEQLLESRRDRDTLLGTPFVGFCRIDVEQNVVAWNEGAERLLGWKAGELFGRRLPIATEASRALLEEFLSGALLGHSNRKIEAQLYALVHKHGLPKTRVIVHGAPSGQGQATASRERRRGQREARATDEDGNVRRPTKVVFGRSGR